LATSRKNAQAPENESRNNRNDLEKWPLVESFHERLFLRMLIARNGLSRSTFRIVQSFVAVVGAASEETLYHGGPAAFENDLVL